MKKTLLYTAAFLLLAHGACLWAERSSEETSPRENIRNNAYSLLHTLLKDQNDVDNLLIVKHARPEIKDWLREVASASDKGLKKLELFAEKEETIELDDVQLPAGEKAVRESISKARAAELLGCSGKEFERALLLSQIEALGYATHLARIANEEDTSEVRSLYLKEFASRMEKLRSRGVRFLRVRE